MSRSLLVTGVGYKAPNSQAITDPFSEAKPNMGAAVALQAAMSGYDVVITARSEDKLNRVAAAIRERSGRGVDVVVTDHHEAADDLAPAAAVVNPRLSDCAVTSSLAGVGVAFKLCHAKHLGIRNLGHCAYRSSF